MLFHAFEKGRLLLAVVKHVNLILAKLNAANRAEAATIALRKHLLKT